MSYHYTMNLKEEIQKIQNTPASEIAVTLKCSPNMARKFKTGFSGLSNEQAVDLNTSLGLNSKAFNALYLAHSNRTKENSNKAIING